VWAVKHGSHPLKAHTHPRTSPLAQLSTQSSQETLDVSPSDIASNWFFKDALQRPRVPSHQRHSVSIWHYGAEGYPTQVRAACEEGFTLSPPRPLPPMQGRGTLMMRVGSLNLTKPDPTSKATGSLVDVLEEKRGGPVVRSTPQPW
jgi:hypothetical protein